ncbi:hypothetical protein B4U79_01295 [Dinothrombium tinctorium]|uniref:Uncharacterized protein n=1 Tax=Dinothrombium tinctorium TaxID=1965070 RepID=A0A3S3PHE3_9ACAR|nr:hypothetical protein B4U79_04494 [Dinothrombium tinctorium]RWS00790.1 hypothetical protein B4U79_12661 [Dinothrombium tinctorium]RWS01052.1 hypothetical protein B4U79_04403 [Dinothrombium tinctorium]RWS02326.1 hypothetical protein B4U79_01295 [Dinothrombium tinctorium]
MYTANQINLYSRSFSVKIQFIIHMHTLH